MSQLEQGKQQHSYQQERLNRDYYNDLKISKAEYKDPYVFVSYKSQDYDRVFPVMAELQQRYGLRLYYDKAFVQNNEFWVKQVVENLNYPVCPVILCFISKAYTSSYATLLELMHSQVGGQFKKGVAVIPIILESIPLDNGEVFEDYDMELAIEKQDTGLPEDGLERNEFYKLFKKMLPKLESSEGYTNKNQDTLDACLEHLEESNHGDPPKMYTQFSFRLFKEILNYLNCNYIYAEDYKANIDQLYIDLKERIETTSGKYSPFGVLPEKKSEPERNRVVEDKLVESKREVRTETPEPVKRLQPVVSKSPEPVARKKSEPVARKKPEPVARKKPEPVMPPKEEPVMEAKIEPLVEKAEEVVSVKKVLSRAYQELDPSEYEIEDGFLVKVTTKKPYIILPQGFTAVRDGKPTPKGRKGRGEDIRGVLEGNDSLRGVQILEGVVSLGAYMFHNCTNLEEVTLPYGLARLPAYGFEGCKSLTILEIPHTVQFLGEYLCSRCGSLTEFQIPKLVRALPSGCFAGCASLKELGEYWTEGSITEIGSFAFRGCNGLEYITLPEITTLRYGTFEMCRSLKMVVLPRTIKAIGDLVFSGCVSLDKVVIPNTVEKVGRGAFESCASLREVTLAKTAKIGSGAFENCSPSFKMKTTGSFFE